jgi:hypothetical protein
MLWALSIEVAACTPWSSASSTVPEAAGVEVAGTGLAEVTDWLEPLGEPSTRGASMPSAANTLP